MATFLQSIKEDLENGINFSGYGESPESDWFTVNRDGGKVIFIGEGMFFYKTFTSYATRVKQLLNRGY
jgi:hypothetical protein